MRVSSVSSLLATLLLVCDAAIIHGQRPQNIIRPYKREPLQDLVTWDQYSIFVKGQRILLYSGEFHPFRLPVPGLWLDIFQKIKALGYNCVSFYTAMNLYEGEQGVFRANGIFDLGPFFAAAQEAGIYLLARPGPYINAEESGGGYPGWMTRINGQLRTNDTAYLDATETYIKGISAIIAKAQITNGGPVILFQPENEYSQGNGEVVFPNADYFAAVEQQYRDAGIVVPFISNDAFPHGYFAPGTGLGAVDIYGYDGYPLGFDCSNPTVWPDNAIPTYYRQYHERQSPTTPNSIVEFQGGAFDPWGGPGFEKCAALLNAEFERVFYKNNFGAGATFFNIYMTYGGTNWGSMSHPRGYTSYDYGAVIKEDRTVAREKYSEAKLEANSLMASPAYLTSTPATFSMNGSYVDTDAIAVWPSFGNKTAFYVIRHGAYNSEAATQYRLTLPTSAGNLTVPQLGGSLTLFGRDSKLCVTDYDVSGYNLLYNTAEVFTHKRNGDRIVLVIYGGPGEQHEAAFSNVNRIVVVEGSGVQIKCKKHTCVFNWKVDSSRKVLQVDKNLFVYLLDRHTAYNYWTVDATGSSGYGSSQQVTSLVLQAGYLIRAAHIEGNTLSLIGDLNSTSPLEIISGAPKKLRDLKFNDKSIDFTQDRFGVVKASLSYSPPQVEIPDLSDLTWRYIDSLPEIQPDYDDSAWPAASNPTTPNTQYKNLSTPTSLYAADYGFSSGILIYRGHFTAEGSEKSLSIRTQGGLAFGASFWLNGSYLGSWAGIGADQDNNSTLTLPVLTAGESYVVTSVIDTTGLDENGAAGDSGTKSPRGILDYSLDGRPQSAITWKLTGNLGGEQYIDKERGPLNEGGLFAERQGYHQPKAPSEGWASRSPVEGVERAGVGYFYTSFDLNLPTGYDIPLSFVFKNTTQETAEYRAQLFVNGYQFGHYVNNIGPQTAFPVPEGILNHQGTNYVGITLWAQQAEGAQVEGVSLEATATIQSGYGNVAAAPQPAWTARPGAY